MVLLDSTFLIDFLNGQEAARRKLSSMSFLTVFTTRINVFEVLTGLFSLGKEPPIAEKLFSDAYFLFSRLNILELSEKSGIKAAEIAGSLNKRGSPISSMDCMIAGIALTNGIKRIITRNEKDFKKIGGVEAENY